MKTFRKLLLLAFLLPTIGFSQEPADTSGKKLQLVTTQSGFEYLGYVISDDGREILMWTEALGKVYIPKFQVRTIEDVKQRDIRKTGEYDPEGVFTTRYYFTNNALPTQKRDNYAMIHLYGPELHFGAGKGFSAGIMTSWGASPFILALKQSIKTGNEKLNFSLGTMMGSSGYFNTFRGWGGMHWATMTYGRPKSNFSLSGGVLYLDPGFNNSQFVKVTGAAGVYTDSLTNWNDLAENKRVFVTPMMSIGGITKIGKKVSFIFDSMLSLRVVKTLRQDYNWTTNTTTYTVRDNQVKAMFFLMPGVRFQRSSKMAFQVALAGVTAINLDGDNGAISFPVPMCSWFFKI